MKKMKARNSRKITRASNRHVRRSMVGNGCEYKKVCVMPRYSNNNLVGVLVTREWEEWPQCQCGRVMVAEQLYEQHLISENKSLTNNMIFYM